MKHFSKYSTKAALAERLAAWKSVENVIWRGSWIKALQKIRPSLQIHLIPADTFNKENAGWWKFQPFNWHRGNKWNEFLASYWGPRVQRYKTKLRGFQGYNVWTGPTDKAPKSTGIWIIIMMLRLWNDPAERATEDIWGYIAWHEMKHPLKVKKGWLQVQPTIQKVEQEAAFYSFSNNFSPYNGLAWGFCRPSSSPSHRGGSHRSCRCV